MTNLDILLEKAESARAWTESPQTKRFWLYLQAEREAIIKALRKAEGLQEVGRSQGELERIDKILSLQDALKDRGPDKGKK